MKPLIRKAFVMQLHPGFEEEYEKRHNPIWPDLEAAIRAHGVEKYMIYLHPETLQLFAYAEIQDEAQWAAIAEQEVCQRWWKAMAPLMATNPDFSPQAIALGEVFRLG